jgi:hypothetical protein
VGLDDALNQELGGLGGEGSGDGSGDGGSAGDGGAVGDGSGGESQAATGGAGGTELGGAPGDGGASTGGDSSSGGKDAGTGGTLGTGGSTVLPGYPCSTDCADPFLLYRTFELGTPAVPEITGGGKVARSSSTVYAGEHSMQFTQGTSGTHARISEKIDLVSSGNLYFRSWIFVPKGAVNDWVNLVMFEGAASTAFLINARASGVIDAHARPDFELASSEQDAVPWGSWFCLQLTVDVQEENGSLIVAVDGQEVLKQTGIDSRPDDGIEGVVYGLGATGQFQTGGIAYFDEVVVSLDPVTCD